jgi:hypothetical protein
MTMIVFITSARWVYKALTVTKVGLYDSLSLSSRRVTYLLNHYPLTCAYIWDDDCCT